MAYKLDYGVKTVHGTNPQNLIEHIVRERIFASTYWKEECFGLNGALYFSLVNFALLEPCEEKPFS